MVIPRRSLAIALACVSALGLLAVAMDFSTIRIGPDASGLRPAAYKAFPGERVRVELADRWASPVRSSNPAVVAPLGGNWFVAAGLGSATLSSVLSPAPGSLMPTLLWRVTVEVGLPGT